MRAGAQALGRDRLIYVVLRRAHRWLKVAWKIQKVLLDERLQVPLAARLFRKKQGTVAQVQL